MKITDDIQANMFICSDWIVVIMVKWQIIWDEDYNIMLAISITKFQIIDSLLFYGQFIGQIIGKKI
jgi:hypothetical protein